MNASSISIGILFNAVVSGIVTSTAFALTIFLTKRWAKLNTSLRAYAWFWALTTLVWLPSSIRYFLIGFGYAGSWAESFDVFMQSAVFFSGPPLIYYAAIRNDWSSRIASYLAGGSAIISVIAIWLIAQPGGITLRVVTPFSAETQINSISLTLFMVEAGIIGFFTYCQLSKNKILYMHSK